MNNDVLSKNQGVKGGGKCNHFPEKGLLLHPYSDQLAVLQEYPGYRLKTGLKATR